MKKILIIRSIRVALVLALLCASMYLMFHKHYSFLILVFISLGLLEYSDSTLTWRLKRIENPRIRTSFIYTYLVAILVSVISVVYALIFTVGPEMGEASITLSVIDKNTLRSIVELMVKNPFNLLWLMYSVLIMLFSFRYYIIVVRVMAMYLDSDEEY